MRILKQHAFSCLQYEILLNSVLKYFTVCVLLSETAVSLFQEWILSLYNVAGFSHYRLKSRLSVIVSGRRVKIFVERLFPSNL